MSAAELRKQWALRFIRRAPDAPVYGSREWLALPDGIAKVAAVLKAAEAWLTEQEERMAQLDAEIRFRALEAKRAEDAAYAARRDRHREEYVRKSYRPHPANRREVA